MPYETVAGRPPHARGLSDEILDAADAAIAAFDKEGYVVQWNRAAARLTGILPAEMHGEKFGLCVVFADDIASWRMEIERAFAGLFSRRIEIRWNCRGGPVVPVGCSFAAIRDGAGNVGHVVCTAIPDHSRELLADRALELRDIGRFLHDTVAQELVVLCYSLMPVEVLSRGNPAHEEAVTALEAAHRCCRDVRIGSSMLAAPVVAGGTLETSIELLAHFLREDAGLRIKLDLDPVSGGLQEEARMLLFATFQQWGARCARCNTKPELTARLRERAGRVILELMVQEQPHETGFRSGWSAFRQRARALGGDFDIGERNMAVCVRVAFPVLEAS